jgi:alpha-beta hydrolase superfamily lysophospholipase
MMNKSEFTYKSSNKESDVYVHIWEAESPIGVIQAVHDIGEHALRYATFAETLTRSGFTVCAADLLGHGRSANGKFGLFGIDDGYVNVIKDIFKLRNILSDKYGGLPFFLLGHGFGSLAARYACSLWGMEYKGAVFSGTCGSVRTLDALYGFIMRLRGSAEDEAVKIHTARIHKYNGMLKKMNLPVADGMPSWLLTDEQRLAEYVNDPMCGFGLTYSGYRDYAKLRMIVNNKSWAKRMPKNLPVLFISGQNDPIGNFGADVLAACLQLQSAGCDSVDMKLYHGLRHDILFEANNDEVYGDIIKWVRLATGVV